MTNEVLSNSANAGFMGGEVTDDGSKLVLNNCNAELPCKLLSRGFCGEVVEGFEMKGRNLHCGKIVKPQVSEES